MLAAGIPRAEVPGGDTPAGAGVTDTQRRHVLHPGLKLTNRARGEVREKREKPHVTQISDRNALSPPAGVERKSPTF